MPREVAVRHLGLQVPSSACETAQPQQHIHILLPPVTACIAARFCARFCVQSLANLSDGPNTLCWSTSVHRISMHLCRFPLDSMSGASLSKNPSSLRPSSLPSFLSPSTSPLHPHPGIQSRRERTGSDDTAAKNEAKGNELMPFVRLAAFRVVQLVRWPAEC